MKIDGEIRKYLPSGQRPIESDGLLLIDLEALVLEPLVEGREWLDGSGYERLVVGRLVIRRLSAYEESVSLDGRQPFHL